MLRANGLSPGAAQVQLDIAAAGLNASAEFADITDGLSGDALDHIADLDSGLAGRAVLQHVNHDNARAGRGHPHSPARLVVQI